MPELDRGLALARRSWRRLPSGVVSCRGCPWFHEGFAQPGLIAIEDIVAVRDLATTPDCEAFYFRHGAELISHVDREYLWPGPREDRLLAVVEELTKEVAPDYLNEVCGDLYDPDLGLLDRGYLAGDLRMAQGRKLSAPGRGAPEDSHDSG